MWNCSYFISCNLIKFYLLEVNRDYVQENLKQLNDAGDAAGLQINIKKTVTIVFGQENIAHNMTIVTSESENSESMYLRSLLT